jgi:hypothetical protein|tara:strand:+ start:579 stop:944 length:366 start_codon:yes stop_codon:yes gene_type:complete
MTTNVKVAQNVSSDGAIITGFRYIDTNLTLGDEGTGSDPTPSTTRVLAIHTYSTLAGEIVITGSKQITNKTAKGTAIRYRVAAADANDQYIGDMGVGIHGILSVANSGTGTMTPTITLYVG